MNLFQHSSHRPTDRRADLRVGVRPDRGFTLIELLIAIVLSGVVAGVTVAALVTALNVSSSTTAQIADSTDAGLISSYLIRDAQSAGATNPRTALPEDGLGVSVDLSAIDSSLCAKPLLPPDGTPSVEPLVEEMVVQFSWIDRTSAAVQPTVVVIYALDADGHLTRRMCKDGGSVDVVLGQHVDSAVPTCSPNLDCTGTTEVSLAVTSKGPRPLEYTLTASLRNDEQEEPTTANSTSVALLALGTPTGTGPCPTLTLSGTGVVAVQGSVLVDNTCGPMWISPDHSMLKPTGTTSSLSGIADPFLDRLTPSAACRADGVNPVIGENATAEPEIVYHQPVTINVDVELKFDPGRYVFCAGLDITSGMITGRDVMFEVVGGAVAVNAAATLDLAAPTAGTYQNLLLWVTAGQAITINFGTHASTMGGFIHAPSSTLQLDSAVGANIGGVIAKSVTMSGAGTMRVGGLPLPTVSISPASLPAAQVGVAYSAQLSASSDNGGAAPYTWAVSDPPLGLPPGLTIDSSGLISGTPTDAESFEFVVTSFDATSLATSVDYSITVVPELTITGPASLPDGQVGVAYVPTSMIATGGSAPTTWSADGLPANLAIDPTTGTISGTPAAAGNYPVTVTATDGMQTSTTKSYTVTIAPKAVAPATCPTAPVGWRGEYFANTTLTAPATVCRDDATIAFDWGEGAPDITLPVDQFSVRWTKVQTFSAGTYLFTVGSDDGSRLYIDGALVFDRWVDQAYLNPAPTVSVLLTGGSHTIVMEHYENSGGAGALLSWVATTPPGCSVAASGWLGEYFGNISLSGLPTLCRDDANINFNWASGTPITGLPTDNFSVRWTRTTNLAAGTYTFALGTDDGGRLYVDGVRVIDRWVNQSYPTSPPSVTMKLGSGSHTFVVEYYERGGSARAVLSTSVVLDNGVTVVPGISGDRRWYGENVLTLTNTADITSMSVTIKVAKTTGVTYRGEYADLPSSAMQYEHETLSSRIDYTFTLKAGKKIAPDTWTLAAQWNGKGTLHPSTGDTWTVTTTSGMITNTVSGTF